MLLAVFAALRRWADGYPQRRKQIITIACLLAGLALVVVGVAVPSLHSGVLSVLLGGAAGVLWTVAANFAYWFMLPSARQHSLDWRARQPLGRRRFVAGVLLASWFAVLLGLNTAIGDSFAVPLGAVNVLVLISLARYAVASDDERTEWSERKESELRQRLFVEAYEKGLIDEYGNPTPLAQAAQRKGLFARDRRGTPESSDASIDKDDFFAGTDDPGR